jgi:cbb3-type cytochrome oxidase subunit 1
MGGVLYLSGALIMTYNFWRTIRGDVYVPKIRQPSLQEAA